MSTIKIKTVQKKNHSKQVHITKSAVDENPAELKLKVLSNKADLTRSLLINVFSKLDVLDSENFDILFPELISNMKEATILREELVNELGFEELIKNRPELFSTPKLIEKKYDNILEIFKEEEKRLGRELNSEFQKKKLIAYQR